MANSTKYLMQIGDTWYFDFRIPQKYKKFFKTSRFRHSLNTSDLKQAGVLRDRYLMPVVSAMCAEEFVEYALGMLNTINLDLERKTKELLQFATRRNQDMKQLTLRDICDYYISCYEKSRKADASVGKFKATSNTLCSLLGANKLAEDTTDKDIILFRDTLLSLPVGWQKRKNKDFAKPITGEDKRTMNPNTVKDEVQRIKAIFARGIDDRKIMMDNPAAKVKVDSVDSQKKLPPAGDNIQKLCSMKVPRSKNYDDEAWKYLPLFARYTGCRIGEIAILQAEDVLQKQGIRCLHVTAAGKHETERQKLKTASSVRFVPISEKLSPHLEYLLKKHKTGYLFPKAGNWYKGPGKVKKPAHFFIKDYNRYAKKIDSHHSIHCWRVYANTQMADAGVDIIDREMLLGHKSDRVQRAYTAENMQRLKNGVDKIT